MDNLCVIFKSHLILQHNPLGLAVWVGTKDGLGGASHEMPLYTIPHLPFRSYRRYNHAPWALAVVRPRDPSHSHRASRLAFGPCRLRCTAAGGPGPSPCLEASAPEGLRGLVSSMRTTASARRYVHALGARARPAVSRLALQPPLTTLGSPWDSVAASAPSA